MGITRVRAICIVVASSTCFALSVAAQAQQHLRQKLDGAWQFRRVVSDSYPKPSAQPTTGEPTTDWMPATVPGDVHLDLLANKKIPEPFYRDNESKLQWIEKVAWEYRRELKVDDATLNHQHLELVFEGLDAACRIYLNGEQLLAPENMFREWRMDVKGKLKKGPNELRIFFPSPIQAAQEVADKDPWRAKTHTDPRVYVRKAAYEYGWDWGPRFVTSGIWRPAYLETWDDARIENVFVEQPSVSATVAHLNVQTEVESSKAQTVHLSLDYGLNEPTKHLEQEVLLAPGLNKLSMPVNIDHPELWWPAGYGSQPLYRFVVKVSAAGHLADLRESKAGLRSIVLHRELDQWGRSFEFVVNGVPVFAKGADVIPFDSFPSRVTTAEYKRILQSAKDANMNMIRHWGGGYYETDEFYDMCDELGLMVWQDLMFGNDWQPGTYEFKQEIGREATYQMRRLRNHPSIVLWSGNNETESLREWNGRGQLPPEVHEHIWQDYLTEFSGVLAVAAATVDPETPYWPSSPTADYEDLSDSYQSGDNHDWTVWHGQKDFTAYNEHHWRFTSEFGFQSFPEMKTIESFTTPDDRTSIFTPVMKAHQKNGDGNKLIEQYMNRYYGEPKDFPSFLYSSQVLQAEAVKVGVEGWRRERPRTMGTIFWQLNDCWPVASWASIDYEGRWKALQYYARRFYSPLLVSPNVEDGALAVYVVSDHVKAEPAELSVRLMHFDGSVLKEKRVAITVKPLSSEAILKIPLSELLAAGEDPAKVVVVAQLHQGQILISSNLNYLVPTKKIVLPTPHIESIVTQTKSGFDVKLLSRSLARSVCVSFDEQDATYSDNYVDLLPGVPLTIHVMSTASLSDLQSQIQIVSLANAFSSNATGGRE
jgi:beta-mannosidase